MPGGKLSYQLGQLVRSAQSLQRDIEYNERYGFRTTTALLRQQLAETRDRIQAGESEEW